MRLKKLTAIAMLTLSTLVGTALAKDSATIKGVVYDSDHKALSKATVRLLHRDGKKLAETDSVTTDSDGAFRFKDVDDGTYVIVAASRDRELRDRSEITIHDGRDPEALSFTVRPGREDREEAAAARADKADRGEKKGHVNFVGQVVDRSGDPVKNAKVRLLTGDNDADTDKLTVVDTVETDGKGRFEFYKVVFGNYVVDATKGSARAKEVVRLKDADGTQSVQLKLK